MPKVSVIVPIYNVENYLSQCLESIINQTLEDIEIICVNDGSTDESGFILDNYAKRDSRIVPIHKENAGYGKTMNMGLKIAKGKYVSIVESDDFIEKDMLETYYQAAEKSGADIVKGRHYDYKAGKTTIHDLLVDFPKEKIINSKTYPKLLYLAHTIWSCFYNKDFLNKNNIRFHETPGASFQDISFALQGWLQAEKVYLIEYAGLNYRNDNPGSSMHNPSKIFCVFDEYNWLEEKFREFWKWNLMLEKYFVATKYGDYISHYNRVGSQYQYALLLRLKECLELDMQQGRVDETAFKPIIWEKISSIHCNINDFFFKSAKELDDLRLNVCNFCNKDVYQNAFWKSIASYPQLIIYGAGEVGKKLAHKLKEKRIKIECFTVTKIDEDNKEYNGIPIIKLEEILKFSESCAIVIAVTGRSQYELYQNLLKYNFKNIFRVDSMIRENID